MQTKGKGYPRFYGRIPLLHSKAFHTFIVDKRNCKGGVFFMKKLSNTKTLTLAAMLTAIGIVLGYFKFPINQLIEIRFAFVPLCLAGLLLGPGIAGVMGILVDIGGFLAYPTGPYFPGFTFSSMMTGVIFGLFLYKASQFVCGTLLEGGSVVGLPKLESVFLELILMGVSLS